MPKNKKKGKTGRRRSPKRLSIKKEHVSPQDYVVGRLGKKEGIGSATRERARERMRERPGGK